MKRIMIYLALLIGLTVGCTTSKISGYYAYKIESMMCATNFVSSTGFKLNYRVAIPEVTDKVPLIVYLHGSGERGDDNVRQLQRGSVGCILKYMVEENEQAVLVAPQCPTTSEWEGETLQAVYELIQFYRSSAIIDANRIYLTGFSMGGYGTWKLGLMHPEAFTALAPVAGGPLMGKTWTEPVVSDSMRGMNIWAVQYTDDAVVNPNYSKKITSQLWTKDSMSAHLIEVLSGGHTCEIYSQREFLDRIFGSRKLTALYQ